MIAYTVTATLPDVETTDAYLDWLLGGHLGQVLEGGAIEATVVRSVEPEHPIEVESRYLFPSREAYDRYVVEVAPALRADGLDRFEGVMFARKVGELHRMDDA